MSKRKIAFVVQRYGKEVNGGAEYHCRIIAEKLTGIYEVDVLTSCATDYSTWANAYTVTNESINGVNVLRFAVPHPRMNKEFRALSRKFANRKPYLKLLKFLGLLDLYRKLLPSRITEEDSNNWAKYQGPYIPDMISFLTQKQHEYDAVIFFTYLYYPTIAGLDVCPEKSILIPTAHDEPPIYFPVFKNLFSKPKAILYNTLAEKRFVNQQFNNQDIYSDIVGIGIEKTIPEFRLDVVDILHTTSPYLIYIGRIDASKGCKVMCDYFLKFKKANTAPLKLVLVGQEYMPIPQHEDILSMGFVTEDVKISLLEGAKALIIPSFYESLSMVTLESMAHGIPVIANGNCEVLKDHITISKAGFTFVDFKTFQESVTLLLDPGLDLPLLQERAAAYVEENYNWSVVTQKIIKAIDYVSS